MRILLTGGAGFIGSHITDAYLREGHSVAVIDDLTSGSLENLNPQASFFKVDIRSEDVKEIFEKVKPEVVNHHAAFISVRNSFEQPYETCDVNVLGTLNLLELSVKNNVKHFIFASTGGALYGDAEEIPTSEDAPLKPLSPYALTKVVAEDNIRLFYQRYSLPYTILRYGNVYGPRQDPHGEAGVVAIFIGKLLRGECLPVNGDGNQTRDFIYVDDIVRANLAILTSPKMECYNLGTSKETSVNQIIDALGEVTENRVERIYREPVQGEVRRSALSSKKALQDFKWFAETEIREGLRRTYAWFKNRNENKK